MESTALPASAQMIGNERREAEVLLSPGAKAGEVSREGRNFLTGEVSNENQCEYERYIEKCQDILGNYGIKIQRAIRVITLEYLGCKCWQYGGL